MLYEKPHEYGIESAVVNALIIDPSKLAEITVTSADFENQSLKQIFDAITHLVSIKSPVDIITVGEYLDKHTNLSGWISTIGQFMKTGYSSPANISTYANELKNRSIEHKTQIIAQRLLDDPSGADQAIQSLMDLTAVKRDYEHTGKEAVLAAMDEVERVCNGEMFGVKSGLIDFDNKIGALHNSDLIVVGARPSMGKTALLLNLSERCGVPAGIISSEQPSTQLGQRMIAINGRVSAHRMRLGKVHEDDWIKISNVVSTMKNRKLFINDKPTPHIYEVIRQARKWKYQYDIKILYVDYIQIIRGVGSSLREQVGNVAKELRKIARELDIPVVALAQVNRKVEERSNKRPMVSDLKEAGEIEQEADVIVMLYRDEVYNEKTSDKGVAELIIGKNRHGPIGTIKTLWQEEYMRFDNYADHWVNEANIA